MIFHHLSNSKQATKQEIYSPIKAFLKTQSFQMNNISISNIIKLFRYKKIKLFANGFD